MICDTLNVLGATYANCDGRYKARTYKLENFYSQSYTIGSVEVAVTLATSLGFEHCCLAQV